MKNTLGDLHNLLMGQVEALADSDLSGDELERELARSKALGSLAGTVIDNARLVLDAQELAVKAGSRLSGREWQPLLPGDKDAG